MTYESPKTVLGFGGALADVILHVTEQELKEALPSVHCGDVLRVTPERHLQIMARLSDRRIVRTPGGSVSNTLCVMAHHGLNAKLLGAVGNDDNGAFMRTELQRAGVDVSQVRVLDGHCSDCCLALVTPDGERTMLPMIDAGACENELMFGADAFLSALHLHLEGYCVRTPMASQNALSHAVHSGLTTSMDLGAVALLQEYRKTHDSIFANWRLDWLFGNYDEASFLTGCKYAADAAMRLRRQCNCRNAIVTCGGDGAVLALEDGSVLHIPAAPLPGPLVDTIGAGDTFTGTFLTAALKGDDAESAARAACVAAAGVVCRKGATLWQ